MSIVEVEAGAVIGKAAAEERSDAEGSSYRQILRSSSIVGGASVLNIVIGLVRTKVAALWLGPAGIGLIGLFQNLMVTAATVSALGFGTAGTRQIAEARGRGDTEAVVAARRGLFWGTLGVAIVGAVAFWGLRGVLARAVLGDARLSAEVGWLALGVALTVAAGSQGALLTGLRRIGDIARVSVLSALLSTILGVSALWVWGQDALLAFVLTAPLASFLLGHVFVARLPRIRVPPTPLSQLIEQWRTLAKLGAAFMVAGLAGTVGQLAVRTVVQRELGAEALGHFQAAWMISMNYIGFVLAAMGKDYYPRLTAAMQDPFAANRMVNEQTEVATLLAAPVLLAMLGLAPWIIELLYSGDFAEATKMLQWQVLGDVLKVASFPLSFIILAAGDGREYIAVQTLSIGIFVCITWVGLSHFGLSAAGIAFLSMYMVALPILYVLARHRTGFRWDGVVLRNISVLSMTAIGVLIISHRFEKTGAIIGVIFASVYGLYGIRRLGKVTNKGGDGGAAKLSHRLFGNSSEES